MQYHWRLWGTLLLIGTLVVPLSLNAESSKDMKAVKNVVKLYEDVLNSNSLDGVVNVFDMDAVVLPPNAPAVARHAAIRQQYKGITDPAMSLNITLEIQELIM